jgi:hypothetical protein
MIKKFAVLPTALGLFLMLGMTGSLLAQPSNGSIHGTVVDGDERGGDDADDGER